ncbi:hypothetical protein DVH24_018336 [Malus domestica]|uniref:Uncharacterized protein n=1 Tax=Malus domestica TaxID=3750 RepID=A0A498KIQ6_MALDO|nr:hypothetical protein DVH24_018336 [Malus domestica]
MEPEASELPKGLVLGRDGNIHLRITPLGDVGCYNLRLSALHFRCSSSALLFCVVTVKPRQYFILYNKTKMNSNIKC